MIVIMVFIALVGCFFLFFEKPTNKKLYTQYFDKVNGAKEYDILSENEDLNISLESDYYRNQYHYVITITSNKKLTNFKAIAIDSNVRQEYYPSFGLFDNQNVDLVTGSPSENETKGVNLVISYKDKIESIKIYVSYGSEEHFYLLDTTN